MARGQYDIAYHPRAITNPEGNWTTPGVNTTYESLEFTVDNATTHYNVKTTVSGAFGKVTTARTALIRSDSTITVKFNATTNDAITLTSLEEYLKIDTLEISNIFITNNSGGAAAVKIILT